MTNIDYMPILLTQDERRKFLGCPTQIPMSILSSKQAKINHSQTLSQLARRGGIGPDEAIALIFCRRWKKINLSDAITLLNKELHNDQ